MTRMKYQLRDARIQTVEVPRQPGAYRLVAYLRPNLVLEELSGSLRVVIAVPEATPLADEKKMTSTTPAACLNNRPAPPRTACPIDDVYERPPSPPKCK
jgi:hypothetical protein